MKYQNHLSDLYNNYTGGSLSKKEFEGQLFNHVLHNVGGQYYFDGNVNRWEDFVSWVQPRLTRAIDLYRNTGSSFDAYIAALVRCTTKEYRMREANHRVTEYVCWQARMEEISVHEAEVEYMKDYRAVSIPDGLKPRHLLVLLLKSYHFVSQEFARHVSRTIGMKPEIVLSMIDELKKRRSEKEAAVLSMRERLYCQHYRCLSYEKRMNSAQAGTAYHTKLKDRLERAKRRFSTMKKRVQKMRLDPSNQMISEVSGIPKGTVDSSLFVVKSKLASLLE